MTIGERFNKVRNSQNMNMSEFAKYLKIPQSIVSEIESEKKDPSKSIMIKLSEILNIDINWLLTGNGEMFIKSEDSSSASSANINQPEKTNQIPSVENVKDVSNEKELIKYLSRLLTESQQETDDIKDKYEELRRENTVLKGIKDGLSAAIVSVEQKKIEK